MWAPHPWYYGGLALLGRASCFVLPPDHILLRYHISVLPGIARATCRERLPGNTARWEDAVYVRILELVIEIVRDVQSTTLVRNTGVHPGCNVMDAEFEHVGAEEGLAALTCSLALLHYCGLERSRAYSPAVHNEAQSEEGGVLGGGYFSNKPTMRCKI